MPFADAVFQWRNNRVDLSNDFDRAWAEFERQNPHTDVPYTHMFLETRRGVPFADAVREWRRSHFEEAFAEFARENPGTNLPYSYIFMETERGVPFAEAVRKVLANRLTPVRSAHPSVPGASREEHAPHSHGERSREEHSREEHSREEHSREEHVGEFPHDSREEHHHQHAVHHTSGAITRSLDAEDQHAGPVNLAGARGTVSENLLTIRHVDTDDVGAVTTSTTSTKGPLQQFPLDDLKDQLGVTFPPPAGTTAAPTAALGGGRRIGESQGSGSQAHVFRGERNGQAVAVRISVYHVEAGGDHVHGGEAALTEAALTLVHNHVDTTERVPEYRQVMRVAYPSKIRGVPITQLLGDTVLTVSDKSVVREGVSGFHVFAVQVMEWVGGVPNLWAPEQNGVPKKTLRTLKHLIQAPGFALTRKQFHRLAFDFAEAVVLLERAQVAHRDLSWNNVLVYAEDSSVTVGN